ncbi:3-hydroxy-acyl-(acyl-carrier-protein) dehydratase [Alphaproteobacteria bacterium]
MAMDIQQIMKLLPHRYPFLLIDRIVKVENGERVVAMKNVTINENFFTGHFPAKPVMPGVLIIESMAQAAIALVASAFQYDMENKMIYFMSIEKAHFRRPVVPGDTLYLHVEKIMARTNVWKMKGEVKVDDVRVADAVFSAILTNK